MKEQVVIQRILRERYEGMRIKNASYSVRAFSKKLGISPGTLSLILNGRRKISRKLVDAISKKLLLDPQERSELLSNFPVKAKNRIPGVDDVDPSYLQLNADQYHVIADWRAFAILNLIKLPDFKNDADWIAERINTSPVEVKQLLERMIRLEMIEEDQNGNLIRAHSKYRTTDDVTNLSLKKSHFQDLELATKSLENESIEKRDFTSMTFPMDLEKMTEAKVLIRKFQDDLFEILEKESKPTEVYRLAIQLFPLSKPIKNDPKKGKNHEK